MKACQWRQRLLICFLVLVLVVLSIPAHWLAVMVGTLSANRVRLADAEGVWYSGNANLFVQESARGPWVSLGKLRWQLPAEDGIVSMELDQGRGVLSWRGGGPHFQLAGISLPASLVLGMPGSGLPTGTYGGRLDVEQGVLHKGEGGQWRGEGLVHWRSATASYLDDYHLGDINISWQLGKSLVAKFSGLRANSHSLLGGFDYAKDTGAFRITGNLVFVEMPGERLRLALKRFGGYELLPSGHSYHFSIAN